MLTFVDNKSRQAHIMVWVHPSEIYTPSLADGRRDDFSSLSSVVLAIRSHTLPSLLTSGKLLLSISSSEPLSFASISTNFDSVPLLP